MALFRRRILRIRKLSESNSIVFWQETRATDVEVQLLRNRFHSASLYGTCGSGVGASGIVTMISRDFADQCPLREFVTVVPGRIFTLRCASRVWGVSGSGSHPPHAL